MAANDLTNQKYGQVFQAIIIAAIIVTFGLITLGGVVRITESGLGCPDWPLCHGSLIPPFEFHTLIEYSHRLTASLVIVLVAVVTGVTWLRYRNQKALRFAFTASLFFLFIQAVLGGITVIMELPPLIVAIHLVVSQGILAFLLIGYVLTLRIPRTIVATNGASADNSYTRSNHVYRRAIIATVAAYIATISGAYVVAASATGSCPDWPLCHGTDLLPAGELPSIHMAHRILVVLLGAVIVWGVLPAWRERQKSPYLGYMAALVVVFLGAQVLVGALNPLLDFIPSVRALHLTLATLVGAGLVILVALAFGDRAAIAQGIDVVDEQGERPSIRGTLGDYILLTKPWIMSLLLVTALGGAILAAEGMPPWRVLVAVLLGGALASGGASALNHYMDQDIDQHMKRTRLRPVANKRIPPNHAAIFGLTLNVLSFALLWNWANLLAALLAMGGSVFYILVYTSWLKRSTTQNIVIGGAAGAVPPLVGWAAVTGGLGLPALFLFAIIFYWTPPHFWALALLIQKDYAEAKVPMLPVIEGEESTRKSIFLYTLILSAITILFYATTQSLGILYLGGALLLGGFFIAYATQLLRHADRLYAVRLYKYSQLYLALLFLLIMVDSSI